jgi:hypothetical protein
MTLWNGGGELSQEQPASKVERIPTKVSFDLASPISLNVRLMGDRAMGSEPEPIKSYSVCFQ